MKSKQKTQRELVERELAKRRFKDFITYTFAKQNKNGYSMNWHHEVLIEHLEAWIRNDIERLIISVEPRGGKALALDTPIPTPDRGFVAIGDLAAGDLVYDERGEPTRVVAVSPVWKDRECYRVYDERAGWSLVADAEHEWAVSCEADAEPEVLTTREMHADFGGNYYVTTPDVAPEVLRGLRRLSVRSLEETYDTVCIEVENDSHLFLAGEGYVPTHNSEIVSRRLPAYIHGIRPDAEIIAATYGQDLSSGMAKDVARILDLPEYQEMFPNTRRDVAQASKYTTTEGGVYLATSVGGAMAGFGANYLIIDDPFKNRAEAESATTRESVWNWFNNDALTRLVYPASTVVMATRWHQDDLTGRILNSPGADRWTVLNIPSIALDNPAPWDPREPGQPIWPERYVGMHRTDISYEEACERALAEYQEIREKDAYLFSSLYMGEPTPSEGTFFKRHWFENRYTASTEAIVAGAEEVLISIDASFGGTKRSNDPVEMLVLARKGKYIYVLDEVNRRLDFPGTLKAARELKRRYPSASMLIEVRANGQALVDTLKAEFGSVYEFSPGSQSKAARAHYAAHRLESGDVLLPPEIGAPWISEFVEDFIGFGSRPHDDRIDALSQACIRWENRGSAVHHVRETNRGMGRLISRLQGAKKYGRFW